MVSRRLANASATDSHVGGRDGLESSRKRLAGHLLNGAAQGAAHVVQFAAGPYLGMSRKQPFEQGGARARHAEDEDRPGCRGRGTCGAGEGRGRKGCFEAIEVLRVLFAPGRGD